MVGPGELSKNIILFGFILTTVTLSIVGFVLSRNIAKPLTELTNQALQIADGNLPKAFTTNNRGDEIGILTLSFSEMVDNIKSFVMQSQEGVNVLSASSSQISANETFHCAYVT